MTVLLDLEDIKRRYRALEVWTEALATSLENQIQAQTASTRFHCFVMDQFEEAYPEEHVSRDLRNVFISIRLALDLKGLPEAQIASLKSQINQMKPSFQILRESFHDNPFILDFDWHISEQEWQGDEGVLFTQKVLNDSELLARQLVRSESVLKQAITT